MFACLVVGAASAWAGPIRILVLGDSITQGGYGLPSYRDPLIRILNGENVNGANPPPADIYSFEFLGSLSAVAGGSPANSDYPTSLNLHPAHEGHYGWRTDQILNGHSDSPEPGSGTGELADWLAGYDADIALIHLGTNDAIHDAFLEPEDQDPNLGGTTWGELELVINAVKAGNPDIRVFVAKLIPMNKPEWGPDGEQAATNVQTVNGAIVSSVPGSGATLVEFTGFELTMLDDGIHPNEDGEAFMAATWFGAIKDDLDDLSDGIEAWRRDNFNSPANSGDGADDNDFDGDGLVNLFEYAVGTDPLVPNGSPVVTTVENDGVSDYLTVTVPRNPDAVDVTFSAESGSDPGALTDPTVVLSGESDSFFKARDSVPIGTATPRLMQIIVTRP